ncbi:BI1 isoform A [Micractinium conductrix]|uniref:BI1 isoform A n=1 Tax=Micractinium conductrix TaxID=554055 RepID=A0A2P6VQ46_9CHLO|nr:BI1 isoform A [Micractinium conductrix]|eukprot:PSC76224.1 BI1 isoform A [Micractinium conductrix]
MGKIWGSPGYDGGDVESGTLLYPGADALDNQLRWGFVRKVYGIITLQLACTALVAAAITSSVSVQHYLSANWGWQIGAMVVSMLGLIPLYIYRQQHPTNLILLFAWTPIFSVTVGMACSFYAPYIVLEALMITAGVVAGLTAYTFHATKRGVDFSFMGPMLWGCLWALIIWSVIQIFWPPGPVGRTIFSLLGAVLFCGCLVFDTQLLIQRYDMDDYIWASLNIYLDVVNLFLESELRHAAPSESRPPH